MLRDLRPLATAYASAFGTWASIVIVGVGIAAIPVDNAGRQDYNHARPLPARVLELAPDAYLVRDRTIAADQICTRGTSQTRLLPEADYASYVTCVHPQTWNDARPGSPNYGNAIVDVVTSSVFQMIAGIGLGVMFVISTLAGGAQSLRKRRERRRDRRATLATLENQRRELVQAFAREEISHTELESGLARLYKDIEPAA